MMLRSTTGSRRTRRVATSPRSASRPAPDEPRTPGLRRLRRCVPTSTDTHSTAPRPFSHPEAKRSVGAARRFFDAPRRATPIERLGRRTAGAAATPRAHGGRCGERDDEGLPSRLDSFEAPLMCGRRRMEVVWTRSDSLSDGALNKRAASRPSLSLTRLS